MRNSYIAPNVRIDAAPPPGVDTDADGTSRLLRLAEFAEQLGADRVRDEARDLAGRAKEGRFYVACVGQFKRGKSTLINALIGEQLLPTGFVPVTAVPTIVRYGKRLGARVRLRDDSWRYIETTALDTYVSEQHNPRNAKGVVGLEVFAPSPLLDAGLCLVDTPGLGSVFTESSAATACFIPHIDAVLVVLGADPPLTGEELALIEAIAPHVETLLVVLNKADRTTDSERSAAAGFAQNLLENRLRRPVGPILEVSASERLENRGPERDWRFLNEALLRLVRDSRRRLINAACERGVRRLGEQLLVILNEQHEALRRPIDESEHRIGTLKDMVVRAERSLVELGFLMMAERQRICGELVVRHRAFLDSVLPKAIMEFEEQTRSGFGPSYRRRRMHQAQEIARRHVVPWLGTEQQHAEQEYRRASGRFVELGNQLLEALAQDGMTELVLMPDALDDETGFRPKSGFSFAELIEVAQPASPLRWLADIALSWAGAHTLIEREARQFLERLLETNTARVRSDILHRLEESQNRLEADLRRLLHEVVRIAERALVQAKQARAAGAEALAEAVAHSERLEHEIHALQPGRQPSLERHAEGAIGQGSEE